MRAPVVARARRRARSTAAQTPVVADGVLHRRARGAAAQTPVGADGVLHVGGVRAPVVAHAHRRAKSVATNATRIRREACGMLRSYCREWPDPGGGAGGGGRRARAGGAGQGVDGKAEGKI